MAEIKNNDDEKEAKQETVKVASIQAPSVFKDTQANIKLFASLIKEAASKGAKFIVLPEAAITGYASQDFKHSWCIPIETRKKHLDKSFTGHDPEQYAEYKDGEMVQYFQKLCKELKVYLTVPYIEKVDTPLKVNKGQEHDVTFQNKFFEDYKYKFYNAISLISPSGDVVGHYRKTNLWPYYDYPFTTPGNKLVTVDTEYGKVGLGICFDVHKILPGYKQLNIWTLLYCIAWVDDADFIWFSRDLPEILNNKEIPYNVIGCNWSVKKIEMHKDYIGDNDGYDWDGYGKTHLYGPKGTVLASTDNLYGNEILYADIPCGK